MSSPRVFVTGASGYVGGNTVGRLIKKHPEYDIVLLVRDEDQKAKSLAAWPSVKAVIGNLDDTELLIEQGKKADVVLRMPISKNRFLEIF
jgi:uncharacterized protein YbjT (DUF2867 family)